MISFLSKMFSKAPEPVNPPEPLHVHTFELIAKTVAEPQNPKGESIGALDDKTFLGCTSFLWQCVECTELRKVVLLGSEEPTLPNLLAKVNEQGPIKIIRDGRTYLVGPLEEPRQPGTLPVR